MKNRVTINRLPTGVLGLVSTQADDVSIEEILKLLLSEVNTHAFEIASEAHVGATIVRGISPANRKTLSVSKPSRPWINSDARFRALDRGHLVPGGQTFTSRQPLGLAQRPPRRTLDPANARC